MNARTGLAAEVPSRELCEKMAAIPELREAFKDSVAIWVDVHDDGDWFVALREGAPFDDDVPMVNYPAPTVREMLVWLLARPNVKMRAEGIGLHTRKSGGLFHVIPQDKMVDPDALVEACIAVVS